MIAILSSLHQIYPLMQQEDDVKAVFQSMLGVGHILADETTIVARLEHEMKSTSRLPEGTDEALWDDLGSRYMRLNLRPACSIGIRPEWIARMMLATRAPSHSRQGVRDALAQCGFYSEQALDSVLDDAWLPSHSAVYHQAYMPAYRVIDKRFAPFFEVLRRIASCTAQRVLIAIDGPCGSGKTTFASQLAGILCAQIVHTDDFVIPHARKTKVRLAEPGGNEDHERLFNEIIEPWMLTGQAHAQPYICHEDRMGEPIELHDARYLILEGSYSFMPAFRELAGIRVWMSISSEEQMRRLSARESERSLAMFINRWIPLERAYHQAFCLPDPGCIILDGLQLVP